MDSGICMMVSKNIILEILGFRSLILDLMNLLVIPLFLKLFTLLCLSLITLNYLNNALFNIDQIFESYITFIATNFYRKRSLLNYKNK